MLVQYSLINLSYILYYYSINLTQQFASVNMWAVSAILRVEEKSPLSGCYSCSMHILSISLLYKNENWLIFIQTTSQAEHLHNRTHKQNGTQS